MHEEANVAIMSRLKSKTRSEQLFGNTFCQMTNKDVKKSRDLSATAEKLGAAKNKGSLYKTQDEKFFKTTENLVELQDPVKDDTNFEYMSSDNLKRKNFNYLTTSKKKKQKRELNLTGDLKNSTPLVASKNNINNSALLMTTIPKEKSQKRDINY